MRAKWGQNFLVSAGIAERIVNALGPSGNDWVLEIGPGRGILTTQILPRVEKLVAVELDSSLAEVLKNRLSGDSRFQLIQGDFLETPLPSWPAQRGKILSNLPYGVANQILQKCLDWSGWSHAVVMVQKEVAQRITARPGDREQGLLSLSVQAKAKAQKLFDVPPGAFRPAPRVMSTVLKLERLPVSRLTHEKMFFAVARAAFQQRRKTLMASLSTGLKLPKETVREMMRHAGLSGLERPEQVDLEQFQRLAEVCPPGISQGTSTQST